MNCHLQEHRCVWMLPWQRLWTESLDYLPRDEPGGERWLSPTGTPPPPCLKRSPRWRWGHAPMVFPPQRSAAPAACASCWRGSTSLWWERLPSAHSCLPPTPPSSSDRSYCWWPFPFSGPVACAAACPLPTARGGQWRAAGAWGWWGAAGWPAGQYSRSRPASTLFRTPRPCSSAPRPRLGRCRFPARRRSAPKTPRQRPAKSLPRWTPTALLLLCRPVPSTQPRPHREGRWDSTCHVTKRSPSSAGTPLTPEWCKYPSGPGACGVWPVSPDPLLCHISGGNTMLSHCSVNPAWKPIESLMDSGFWKWNSYLSRVVFLQVFAVDVGHSQEFSCLSCQNSSQRACVKRAGLEPF